jgi:uncharacterized protein (DUF488 family)
VATELFTIGHSTHSIGVFLALLTRHRISVLADVRRFPGSRKHPHFGHDALVIALAQAGLEYRWFEALGGRRPKQTDLSPNLGLRNQSFRNYADDMTTPAFREAMTEVVEIARRKRITLMCSEGLYWRCHRRLISDYLTGQCTIVWHIMPSGELKKHEVTTGAQFDRGEVTYPAPRETTLFE